MTCKRQSSDSRYLLRVLVLGWLILVVLGAARADSEVTVQEFTTTLVVRSGQDSDGRPTQEWLRAIGVFHDDQSLRQIAQTPTPFSYKELQWAKMIERRAAYWPGQIEALGDPFSGISVRRVVVIVLGNIGGNDAFIAEGKNIAFDLSDLLSLYGAAELVSSVERIDRFFAHEFTHLLHREWRRVHQPAIQSPLERALWVCLAEGLGNYRSLSARWTDPDGRLSQHAKDVLSRLQPILVERLSLLEEASDDEAGPLLKGLSMGPFEEKWGALSVALWLTQEAKGDDNALRKWVDAGPWGILDLASKYLPYDLAARLPENQNNKAYELDLTSSDSHDLPE